MGKKKTRSRKKLLELALSNQHQYNLHQEKIRKNPKSLSVDHWKKIKRELSIPNKLLSS
jgi:hypothetical protein